MFDLSSIMQPAITAGVAVIGWWVKGIRADFKELSANLEAMRAELHQEMQQYTRTDTCEAHRRSIQAQIDILRREQELRKESEQIALKQAVNDERRMRALYDSMTPAERRAHAEKCNFRSDMEGLG